MKIGAGAVDHDQIGGVSIDDHHARDHAASHSDAGADEVTVDNLATGSVDVSRSLKPDGSGGVEFADTDHADLANVGVTDHHDHAATGLVAHSATTGKTATDHHDHVATGLVAHSDTTGRTANDHHNQLHAAAHKDGGGDELDAEELATAGAANTFLAGDGAGAASMRAIVQADLPSANCLIAVGTYTGDGSTSQVISGLGFTPDYVHIWVQETSSGASRTTKDIEATLLILGDGTGGIGGGWESTAFRVDRINAFASGSFTVDDGGSDLNPNKNTVTYYFKALGR